jgi:hypothetical protein
MSQDSHRLLSFLPARCLASVSFLADTKVILAAQADVKPILSI